MVTTRRAGPPAQALNSRPVTDAKSRPEVAGDKPRPREEQFDVANRGVGKPLLTAPAHEAGAKNFGAGKLIRERINDARVQSMLGPYVPEEQFVEQLAQTPEQKKVLTALTRNKEFVGLWNWFSKFPGGNPIRFVVKPGLQMGGVERFGGFYTGELALIVNPAKREHVANPQELVNTIVHELVHAALAVQRAAKQRGLTVSPAPLPEGATDLYHDETFVERFGEAYSADKADYARRPEARAYLEREYGDSDSNPRDEYLDVNRPTQGLVQRVVADNLLQTGIGKVTITGVNQA